MSETRATRDEAAGGARRAGPDPLQQVRTADLEPYLGLRYLSKLFRLIALILLLMLVAEVVTGLARQGVEAIPTLVAEVSRLIVLAGMHRNIVPVGGAYMVPRPRWPAQPNSAARSGARRDGGRGARSAGRAGCARHGRRGRRR
jgi:hypothetical protein